MTGAAPLILHAGVVAWQDHGVLITGPSGSGKSALALMLMAYGCDLVADDRVLLSRSGDRLMAAAPDAIRGRIEARGIGILGAATAGPVALVLAVDMGLAETARMPAPRQAEYLGVSVPLLHKVETGSFPAAIVQYLKSGPTHD